MTFVELPRPLAVINLSFVKPFGCANSGIPSSFLAATMCLTLANMEGDESFDASMLGSADEVVEERVGDNELIFVKAFPKTHLSLR